MAVKAAGGYGRLEPSAWPLQLKAAVWVVAVSLPVATLVAVLVALAPSEAPALIVVSYAPAGASAPLVIDLHGATSTPRTQYKNSGVRDCAAMRGWHAAWPPGVGNTWNAGEGMYWPANNATDHIAELSALANHLRAELNASRVFLTGFSNGCAMSLRLGLEAADGVFDAVACNAHAMADEIEPSAFPVPRPLLLITGYEDTMFSSFYAVNRTLEKFAANNGCGGATLVETSGDLVRTHFAGCAAPVESAVVLYAGHVLDQARTGALQCEFLQRFA